MIPTRIFLDLDDVLNRFTMSALRHVGCPVDEYRYTDFKPEWGWDIVQAANALHPRRRFEDWEFWQSIGRGFWANVPQSNEFSLLFLCEQFVGTENVCILSSPTLDPDCLAGKLEWIQETMPSRFHRQFLFGPRKHFCARPDALLIDDRDKNVEDFRAHGGQAILMPRPWNSLHWANDPYMYVTRILRRLFRRKVAA